MLKILASEIDYVTLKQIVSPCCTSCFCILSLSVIFSLTSRGNNFVMCDNIAVINNNYTFSFSVLLLWNRPITFVLWRKQCS